ncbi:MAG TPA: c-type cytochrome [Burkholderiales bacterium]|nr:c-type cytochrome [Burkholderiales bacterium]
MNASIALVAAAGMMAVFPVFAEPALREADPAKAQPIVNQVCAACHGTDGNSTISANPNLAGQYPEYLTKQLLSFKSGERKSAVMGGMVANLTPEDMKNLGAYFGGKKPKPGMARDKELVALGQKIYRGGNAASAVPACAGCHTPNGAGIPSQFPRLSGQHAEYVIAQLRAFKSGERADDNSKMMRAIAVKLTDQEMRAVAEYISGLR